MPNLVQRSALALIGLLAISSTAFSKELEPLPYKEALAAFNAAGHDSPGVWLCGYSLTDQHFVSVQPSHLPNSSIKADGVRVFLIGRDSPY